MKIDQRKVFYKISWIHSACRGIVDINNYVFYKLFTLKSGHIAQIRALKNSRKGKRCFIVGNGPSLALDDLKKIKQEDCFASNLIFKIFDKTEWRPKYYFLQDRYANVGKSIDGLDLEYIFIGDYFWRKRGVNNPHAICFHGKRGAKNGMPEFSTDISRYIIDHHTVSYSMIQCAAYIGYSEIYLLGMDHSYEFECDSKGNIIKTQQSKSHVFEDENPGQIVANVEGMNKAYLAAREYANTHGIRIVNCTRGGRLEWFERANLDDVV
ncbi:DUF115 domain-containing protein [Collinsella tanakaei]|nr:DUF115 domain-containing protein [Collinsella tanakaei]